MNSIKNLFVLVSLLLFPILVLSRKQTISPTVELMKQYEKENVVTPPSSLSIWPKPLFESSGIGQIVINPDQFIFKSNVIENRVIKEGIERYKNLIFGKLKLNNNNSKQSGSHRGLEINVNDTINVDLQLRVNESYTIEIDEGVKYFKINSETIWGALRGLETFSQLVERDGNGIFFIERTPIFIKDAPRFPWRGLMIDTSRHYLSISQILSAIDGAAYNKLNTIHWHIVDAQSFPVEILQFPYLNMKGAYSKIAIYTQKEIKEVVDYAYLRGVRMVPEFDMPGHAAAWGDYYNITTSCPTYSANLNNIPLNPACNLTYEVVQAVIEEMSAIFFDNYFHLGGDEMVVACWNEDESVKEFMIEKGFKDDYNLLWAYFEERVEPIYIAMNKTLCSWQELALNNPSFKPSQKNAVSFAWINPLDLTKVVTSGYDAVLSAGWYLDQQIPGQPTNYLWGDTWLNFYNNEPFFVPSSFNFTWTDELKEKVLGGEASMWGEQVDDSDFDVRVWPKASATAERLWSSEETKDVGDAKNRITKFRCHSLIARGIRAFPLAPGYCEEVYRLNEDQDGLKLIKE